MIKSFCRHSSVSISWGQIVSYFFQKKYVLWTLTGFCVLKRVGYWHAFFVFQNVARVCPVSARMSLSWHSQRHCWLLMYFHKTLLGRMCANASERAVASHHRSAQVRERYCPTPPHPMRDVRHLEVRKYVNVIAPPHPMRDVRHLQRRAWRMCANASERAVASHDRNAQVRERYCPTPPHPMRDVRHLQRSMTYVRKCKWTCRGLTS